MWIRGSSHRRYEWFFQLRGETDVYGPVGPMTKREMRDYLRTFWGDGKRIPYGTIWWRRNDGEI